MNTESITQSTQYIILSVLGVVLLALSAVMDNTIGAVVGMGSVILAVLRFEVQDIQKNITLSGGDDNEA